MAPTDSGSSTARAAAVAVASSAALVAARHVLEKAGSKRKPSSGGAVATGVDAAWEAAREHLLPMVEQGALAAGRYVAENAPDVVRDAILPRFVDGFREASERRETEATDDD